MSAKTGKNDGGASPRETTAEAEPSLADRLLTEKRLAADRAVLIRFAIKWSTVFVAIYAAYLATRFWIEPLVPKQYDWIPPAIWALCGIAALYAVVSELERKHAPHKASDSVASANSLSRPSKASHVEPFGVLQTVLLVAFGVAWFVISAIAGLFLQFSGLPSLDRFVGMLVTFLTTIALIYWYLGRSARRRLRSAPKKGHKLRA